MDTDHGDLATASTATLAEPAAAEPEVLPAGAPGWTAKVSGAGRKAAGLTRGLLLILFTVVAPIALLAWAVLPRLMSPAALADQVIEVGLTQTLRAAIVDQLSSELADRQNTPAAADEMRSVFDRSLTQDWFDEQVTSVAGELELWLAGTDDEPPLLEIDLVPVKTSLAADPEAIRLVAELVGADERVAVPEGALAGIPDQVSLLSGSEDPGSADDLFAARDFVDIASRWRGMIPLVVFGVFAMIMLLARRGTRLRWTGSALLAVALPILAVAALAPRLVAQQAASLVPAEVALEGAEVEALVAWILDPAWSLALWVLVAGLAAVVASVAVRALRGRPA